MRTPRKSGNRSRSRRGSVRSDRGSLTSQSSNKKMRKRSGSRGQQEKKRGNRSRSNSARKIELFKEDSASLFRKEQRKAYMETGTGHTDHTSDQYDSDLASSSQFYHPQKSQNRMNRYILSPSSDTGETETPNPNMTDLISPTPLPMALRRNNVQRYIPESENESKQPY